MAITRLDHVNLRTSQLETMVRWYADVLGMKSGPRPDFPLPGAWIYAGDVAAVHLSEVPDPGTGSETPLKLEHFALAATDLNGFLAHLDQQSVPYKRSEVPSAGLVQINIWDPDGNHIHVDFSTG